MTLDPTDAPWPGFARPVAPPVPLARVPRARLPGTGVEPHVVAWLGALAMTVTLFLGSATLLATVAIVGTLLG